MTEIKLTGLRLFMVCVGVASASIGVTSCANRKDRSKAESEDATRNSGNFDVSLLQGHWWREDDDSGAVFYILGDSLYYTDEQDAPYFISVKDNTFELTREDVGMSFAIKRLTSDSLVFHDPTLGDEVKFFRKD